MEFTDFDAIGDADLEELFCDYFPQRKNEERQEKVVYLASEYSRIRRAEIPELENDLFIDSYLKDDNSLLNECSLMLGHDCTGKLTRLECAHVRTAYWNADLDFIPSEEAESFLGEALMSSKESTTHLEWVVFLYLKGKPASKARKRLKARKFAFECEIEYSSKPPAAQIREKVRVLSLLNRYWPRSPGIRALNLEGAQPEVELAQVIPNLTPLLEYYKKNPRRRSALRDEMKDFITAMDGTNLSGFPLELKEMKVDLLGRIWVEDVYSISIEFAPEYYRMMVAREWNSTLTRHGYEAINFN